MADNENYEGNIGLAITIIMLCRNQARHLLTAAGSVLENDQVELILVNPGSSDDTERITKILIENFPDRVRLINQVDSGPAEGLNNALQIASGDVISILNGDDIYLPGTIDFVKSQFEKVQGSNILFCAGYIHFEKSGISKYIFPSRLSLYKLALTGGVTFFHQGVFFKRREFGHLRYNPNNNVNWDFEHIVEVFRMNPIAIYSSRPVAVFRIHPISITGSGSQRASLMLNTQRISREILGRHLNNYELFFIWILRVKKFLKSIILVNVIHLRRTKL